MGNRAYVRSIDAIRQFRPHLVGFQAELSLVLAALRQELHRSLDWLDGECQTHWQAEQRRSFDKVAAARTELVRKQMITVAGHRNECIEEKKAFRNAKQRLEATQEKLKELRAWSVKLHRAVSEFQSRSGRIEQAIGEGVPRFLGVLERITDALDAYAAERPPAQSSAIAEDAPEAPQAAETSP